MQKKFEKLLEKEDIGKILTFIKNNFKKNDEELLLENIEYFEKLCNVIKEKNWILSEEIIDIIIKNVDNKWWHVR